MDALEEAIENMHARAKALIARAKELGKIVGEKIKQKFTD